MQAKKAILETKQEILAETIAEAEKRLLSLDDAAYAKVIDGMLKKLDRSLGTEILVSKKDAARLAAHYSSAGSQNKAEVDYVEKKQVKKPNGGKPGFVVYYTNYSMMADTDISDIEKADA